VDSNKAGVTSSGFSTPRPRRAVRKLDPVKPRPGADRASLNLRRGAARIDQDRPGAAETTSARWRLSLAAAGVASATGGKWFPPASGGHNRTSSAAAAVCVT
jgi:hypothetical protein